MTMVTRKLTTDVRIALRDRIRAAELGQAPAFGWIWREGAPKPEGDVVAFKKVFTLHRPETLRLHVTADQRYRLFVDGERVGMGPERVLLNSWYFESYECRLSAGRHTLVALVWHLPKGCAPAANLTLAPGFFLFADGRFFDQLTTGLTPWLAKPVTGIEVKPSLPIGFTGGREIVTAADYPFGFEKGLGAGWHPARFLNLPATKGSREFSFGQTSECRSLVPAALPAMLDRLIATGRCRHAEYLRGPVRWPKVTTRDDFENGQVHDAAPETPRVEACHHDAGLAAAWQAMSAGQAPLRVAAGRRVRFLMELDDYTCVHPEFTVSGGRDAEIRVGYEEALYGQCGDWNSKGNRSEIEGKFFCGRYDLFRPDGRSRRTFSTLWWRACRYLEVEIRAGGAPVTLHAFRLRETRYPLENEGRFSASDGRLAEAMPMMFRTLQVCSHETYSDSAYAENLTYVGDTVLQCLATYVTSHDDRLARKAIHLFDLTRNPAGLVQSRVPCRFSQVIPTYSLLWVNMLRDYALWRRGDDFVREKLPGARAVLEYFHGIANREGLAVAPEGWNFCDWVPGWKNGMPVDGWDGASGLINLHYLGALRAAVELETRFGSSRFAAEYAERATRLVKGLLEAFWCPRRQCLAEDREGTLFSEHSQALGLLYGVGNARQARGMAQALRSAPDLARTTVYFAHYLFAAYMKFGFFNEFMRRMEYWFDHPKRGFRTLLEMPTPERSDCHAWGAHPLYHCYTGLLGIQPADFGFHKVLIRPLLGDLEFVTGRIPHPDGWIEASFRQERGGICAEIALPKGVTGILELGGKRRELRGGRRTVVDARGSDL